ncbi:MAG: tol-pal system protein YbgF [Acidiferrobacterales bacterium]|jgi:tol-pal system protein YbgF|nr:tol-pal system protein YbgF [Acidiferrobacterales bacterium]
MISVSRNWLLVLPLVLAGVSMDAPAAQWRSTAPDKESTKTASPTSETLLELLNQLEALQAEVRELRNQTEVQENEIRQLQSRVQDLTQDLDRRVRTLERGGGTASRPANQSAASPAATPPVAAPTSGQEQQEYEAAFQLMKEGDYTGASRSFRAFITRYPGSPLAANAQYWIAESNYFVRNFNLALKEFLKVEELYPNSRKLSDALLKIGYTYYELGEWTKSRQYLQKVIDRYPNSRNARSASSRLAIMKKEGH